jgi:subtilisin
MSDLKIIDGYNKHDIVKKDIRQFNWGGALTGIPQAWQLTQGEGVRVMVADTGVDYTHPDLKNNFKYGFDCNATPITNDPMDRDGHGTHVCGILCADGQVSGVAPKADLFVAKILGDNGSGSSDNIAIAMRMAMRNNVDLVSMSLGTHDEPEAATKEMVREAIAAGISIVVAAGNEGMQYQGDSVGWPAKWVHDIPEIIVVTAIDQNSKVPAFSSKGDETTIAAPGVQIYSTYLNHQYKMLTGTSMATPFVSGCVALMIAKHRKDPNATSNLLPKDVKKLITDHAKNQNGILGHSDTYGYGVIDVGSIKAAEYDGG